MNGSGNIRQDRDGSARRRRAKLGTPRRRTVTEYISGVDRPFLITVILLLCIGTVMVFSSSYPYAREYYNNSYKFAINQIIWAVVGLLVMSIVICFFTYDRIRRFSKPLLAVGILLLVCVLVVGSGAKGAVRWIQIGPVSFQPSEIMKFALVLFFADYADKYADKIRMPENLGAVWKRFLLGAIIAVMGAGALFVVTPKPLAVIVALILLGTAVAVIYPINLRKNLPGFYYGILPYVIVLGIVGFLMYLQPHISGLIIMAAIIFAMMFIGGTPLYYIIFGGLGGAAMLAVLAMSKSHSSARLLVWQNPFEYIKDGGWQPVQSLYAIGSGGFWGVGFGNSRQKHLYLPEPQNDYIFSIFCEEMGFIGALFVICIFAFFIYRGVVIGLRAPDRFSSMLVLGIIMHVGIQIILNVAVVTNTLPSTGISLPFFSYGGTSLVILLAEMGVVLSVSRHSSVEKT